MLFKVGDIVSRDGSDRQKVIEVNEFPPDMIHVECIREPREPWCEVGDREWNMANRYHLIERAV